MTRKRALRVPEYLQHILDAIDRATSYVAGMDVEAFEADTRTQDAVLHSLQVIGEAANKIRMAASDFAAQYPDIPWELGSHSKSTRGFAATAPSQAARAPANSECDANSLRSFTKARRSGPFANRGRGADARSGTYS